VTAHNPGEELARLGHHEAQAVEVVEHVEQLLALEMRHAIGQLPALTQGVDKVQPGLGSPFGWRVGEEIVQEMVSFGPCIVDRIRGQPYQST